MSESTTKIQLKRKESTSSTNLKNVILDSGEPLYDTTTGLLYIGANENTVAGNTQAINEIKDLSDPSKLKFKIGTGSNNTFEVGLENKSDVTETGTTIAFTLGTLEFSQEVAVNAGSLSVNYAENAGTATNLKNNPSISINDSNQIQITAGGKTSDPITIPYADISKYLDSAPSINQLDNKLSVTAGGQTSTPVTVAYATNAATAKSAESATNATTAETATSAETAKSAETATSAETAKSAETADGLSSEAIQNLSSSDTEGTIIAFKIGAATFEQKVSVNAGSLSVESANMLTTPRTIDGVKFDGSANIHHYFKCDDTSSAIKSCTAEISSSETTTVKFNLETGAHIYVKFTQTNTAENDSGLSLNVQSSSPKTIYYRGAKVTSGTFIKDHIYEFLFDGTYWQLITPLDLDLALAWQTF